MEYDSDKQNTLAVIAEILNGNTKLFNTLEQKYRLLVTSLVRKMIKDEDDVDDLVQEAFLKAYNALSSYNSEYAFSSWLYKITSNACIDFLRKKRNFIPFSQMNVKNEEGESSFDVLDENADTSRNIMTDETKKIVSDAINLLPEKYRKIIEYRHYNEMSYEQISEVLEIPIGTVKIHLFRAKKLLEMHLRKNKDSLV